MLRRFSVGLVLCALCVSVLASCTNSSASRGAAMGAASGAVVGGPAGAALGAAGGALIGSTVDERAARRYGSAPARGYPIGRESATPGMVHSPYTGRLYDVGDIPSGGLVIDTEVEKLFRRP